MTESISVIAFGRKEGWITGDGHKEVVRDSRYIYYLDCGDGFMGVYYVHMTKLIKLYILEMCSLMYINYTSIKLLKRKRGTRRIFQLCFLFINVLAE